MTPWEYSIAIATRPAIAVYMRQTLRQWLGRKSDSRPNRLVRVEYGQGDARGRVYGCFDSATIGRLEKRTRGADMN